MFSKIHHGALARLSVESRDAEAWHALGSALVELGDRAAALVAFRNALSLDESRRQSQLALGNLLFDSGQLDHALRCFAKVEESAAADALTRGYDIHYDAHQENPGEYPCSSGSLSPSAS